MKGYLTFGIGCKLYNDVNELDLVDYTWKKLSQNDNNNENNKDNMVIKKNGRFGHNSIIYQNRLYIFGGEKMYN